MCEHKNLKAVGHRLYCLDCNVELPIEFLATRNAQKPGKKAATAEKVSKSATAKKTSQKGK